MAASGMPHYVPGMGFRKLPPGAIIPPSGPSTVVARTACNDVELKITLSAKLLAKSLRVALIEPFLKVHNKRASKPVVWDDIKCIKVDGYTLDEPSIYADRGAEAAVPAEGASQPSEASSPPPPPVAATFLTKAELRVELVTELPANLLDGVIAVARDHEEITHENYADPPPPPLTVKLIAIAAQAGADATSATDDAVNDLVDVDDSSSQAEGKGATNDADVARRSANAFEVIGGGAEAISGRAARDALLNDAHVRSLCFLPSSPHVPSIDNALRRLAVDARNGSGANVRPAEFGALFAGLVAVACAPQAYAKEEEDPEAARRRASASGGAGDFLQQLLDDPEVTSRRIA